MRSCTRKTCRQANPQPLIQFGKKSKGRDGLDSWCKSCKNEISSARYHADPAKQIRQTADIHKKNPNKRKNQVLKRKFNITIDDYKKMLANQGGKCAICKQLEIAKDSRSGKLKDLAVDHCHKTNKVRGLLCSACNMAVGMIKDNSQVALNLYNYIMIHEELRLNPDPIL